MNYAYGQFTPEHFRAMRQGIQLYNSRQYWDCHEFLEDLWMDDKGDNARYVYWAIIQVATSLHHYERSNLVGAWGMLFKARQKFEEIDKRKVETPFMQAALKWNEFKLQSRAVPRDCTLENFKNLYAFRFPDIAESEEK
jgi:uncharacterized protein